MHDSRRSVLFVCGLFAGILVAAGCGAPDQQLATSSSRSFSVAHSTSYLTEAKRLGYLPRGPGLEPNGVLPIDLAPKPYNSALDGPPLPVEIDRSVGSGNDRPVKLPLRASRASHRSPVVPGFGPGHYASGFLQPPGRGFFGLMQADPGYVIPSTWDSTVVYGPTVHPGGGSCWEVSSVYQHASKHGGKQGALGDRSVAFFDWCNTFDWAGHFSLNSGTFASNYLYTYTDGWGYNRQMYYLEIVADTANPSYGSRDCWHAYLYNFTAGQWSEPIAKNCGWQLYPDTTLNAWVIHESYDMQLHYGSSCSTPAFHSVWGTGFDYYNSSGGWSSLDASSATAYTDTAGCWGTGGYVMDFGPFVSNEWVAATPTTHFP